MLICLTKLDTQWYYDTLQVLKSVCDRPTFPLRTKQSDAIKTCLIVRCGYACAISEFNFGIIESFKNSFSALHNNGHPVLLSKYSFILGLF